MGARSHHWPTGDDALERDLRALFEVDSPPWLESMVRTRVGAARRTGDQRRRHERRRVQRFLLAAALLILGVVACAVAIDRLDPFGREGSVVIGRGTPLDVTAEASGWRLSLVNAYADRNQLDLFMHAEPLEPDRPLLFVEPRDVTVTDESGRTLAADGGADDNASDGRSAHEIILRPTDRVFDVGDHPLTLRVGRLIAGWGTPDEYGRERIAGPWELDFAVTSLGGTLLEPGTSDVRHGVTITLDRLSVSPSMVRAWLTVENAPAGAEWLPVLFVDRGPKHWEGHGYGLGTDGTGAVSVDLGGGGVDHPVGDWSVEISALVERDEEKDVTVQKLSGPWDLSFEVTEP